MKYTAVIFVMAAICMLGISALVPAQEKAPDVVVLKGNPMGGVKFNHTNHAKLVGDKCDTCHHASKPEKAAKSAHENCQNCHTKAATAPMKTNAKAAFHDAMAKAGTCATCHAKQAAAGKKPPLKCPECHKEKG